MTMKKYLPLALLLLTGQVLAAPPVVTFTVLQSAVGGPYTASWAATGATTCTGTSTPVNAAWNGAKALNGSSVVAGVAPGNVLSLSCSTAAQSTADLSWTAPTKNTDGSNLTDLAGYKVFYGQASPPTIQWSPNPGAAALSLTVTGLLPGVNNFAMKSTNAAGIDSDLSGIATKTLLGAETTARSVTAVAVVQPNPPTGLTVAVVVGANVAPAFRILADGTRSQAVAGFVPVAASCYGTQVFTYRGIGYKKIAASDVKPWPITGSPDNVAAPCRS
jgi:hypothetical protein